MTQPSQLIEEWRQSWHYGPTDADPDPGKMWCTDCGHEVWWFDEVGVCGCAEGKAKP